MRFERAPRRALSALLASFAAVTTVGVAAPGANAATPAVSHYSTQVENDGADVYYPTGVTGKLPVALMLQGAKVNRAYYPAYARAIAAYGFAVVVPNHKRLVFFDNNYYPSQKQPSEAIDWMKAENALATSPLKNHINTSSLVLLGHSFGGATGLAISEGKCSIPFCTTLTFKLPAEVKAASLYGTNNKTPVLNTFSDIGNKIPVQLVQGSVDGKALPADAEQSYTRLQNGPKQIVRVAGANHYGITDMQNPAGADADANAQTITQAVSIETSARWAAKFLLAQLGDAAAANYVWSTGDAADPVVTVTGQQ